MKCNNRQELQDRYGVPIGYAWGGERKFMTLYTVPKFCSGWVNTATGQPIKKIYINKDCKDALDQALTNLLERGFINELRTYDGCYNVRPVRGQTKIWSIHSYGLAIDLNASENPLGAEPVLSEGFVKCWTDAGWVWGGAFSRKDGQHFQFADASC